MTIEVQKQDGSYMQLKLPSTIAQTPEHLLYVLYKFKNKAEIYGWNGVDLFEKFRELLIGNACTQWDIMRLTTGQDNTQEAFDRTVRAMVSNLSGIRENYDNFINYLNLTRKPKEMNPSMYITRCMTLFRYVPYLSMENGDAPRPFSETQQKKFIIKMVPDLWQQRMEDAGLSPANTELTRILEFFNNQWKREVTGQGSNKRNNTFNNDIRRVRGGSNQVPQPPGHRNQNFGRNQFSDRNYERNDYFTGTGRGRGKGRGRNNNYDTFSPRYTNRNYSPLHPDEECRLHGGHPWHKFIYIPRRELNAPTVGAAPIVGAARGAGHGRGHDPRENHYIYAITDGHQSAEGKQQAVSEMRQAYYFNSDEKKSEF